MTIIELGAVGQFVGAIAVVVTLIYLAIQMRQNTNALKLNTARSVTEELQDSFSLLASNQELAEIFVTASGELALQGAEQVRFNAFTSVVVRVYENAFLQSRAGVIDQAHWEGMTRMMIDYTSMAAFQTYWPDRKHWVSDEFQEYMETDVISAPPKTGVSVPGAY
jgi:hypothetical protein